MKYALIIFILLMAKFVFAQSEIGEIDGQITDSLFEPVIGAVLSVYQDTVQKGEGVTNYEGKFAITGLKPGRYNVTVQYIGMKKTLVKSVIIYPSGGITYQDMKMIRGDEQTVTIFSYTGFSYNKPVRRQLTKKQLEYLANQSGRCVETAQIVNTTTCEETIKVRDTYPSLNASLPYHKKFTSVEVQRMPIRDASEIMNIMGAYKPTSFTRYTYPVQTIRD